MARSSKQFSLERLQRSKRFAINTVIVLMVVVVLALALGGENVLEHIEKVPPKVLGLLAIASLLENVLRIYRYNIFAAELGLPVPPRYLVLYYVAGMALLPTPGKVGVALRLWLLNYHHHIPYRHSMPLLVMDVVTDTLAMALLIGAGLTVVGAVGGEWLGLLAMGGLMGAIFTILMFPRVARNGVKLVYRLGGRRMPRLFAGINALIHFLHRMLGWRVLLLCTLLSLIAWAGFGIALSGSLMAMGYDVSWLLGGFAVSLSTVLGVVSMAPAGVGGAELSMAAIIAKSGDVPWATAFVLTMLVRTALIWIPVAIGFVALPWALRGPRPDKA